MLPRNADTSLNYTITQNFENVDMIGNHQEILEFVFYIKRMNRELVKYIEDLCKERDLLRCCIEELNSQLQEKCEIVSKQEIIIQECEMQLDSWREKYSNLQMESEVKSTVNHMLDQITLKSEEFKFKSSSKNKMMAYSTGISFLNSFKQPQYYNQDSLFKDSYTNESINDESVPCILQQRKLSLHNNVNQNNNNSPPKGKVMLKAYLKNENMDPMILEKQKNQIKKEINQWQDEFIKKEGRPPNQYDKQLINQKFYQYTLIKKQLENKQKSVGIQVDMEWKSKCQEIRRLNQIIEDYKGKIKVFCRIRPFNQLDKKIESEIDLIDDTHIAVRQKQYQFDACFGPSTTQNEIYNELQPFIQAVFTGFNLCIFAYGQTGSGKTFTMLGNKQEQGVIPRLIEDIFHKNIQSDINVSVQAYEIYKEGIYDLLGDNSRSLDIKEDVTGIYIQNITNLKIENGNQFNKIWEYATQMRRQSGTELNDQSSRSHMILSLCVEVKQGSNRLISKVNLIDLAGSERCSKSKVRGNQLEETKAINKSLSALGDVIMSLGNKSQFIPYRNSKLTYLMKESLGGNSKTIMIINISPSLAHTEETITSLMYGQRVKSIINMPVKNQESSELCKLKQFCRQLQEENAQLKK